MSQRRQRTVSRRFRSSQERLRARVRTAEDPGDVSICFCKTGLDWTCHSTKRESQQVNAEQEQGKKEKGTSQNEKRFAKSLPLATRTPLLRRSSPSICSSVRSSDPYLKPRQQHTRLVLLQQRQRPRRHPSLHELGRSKRQAPAALLSFHRLLSSSPPNPSYSQLDHARVLL